MVQISPFQVSGSRPRGGSLFPMSTSYLPTVIIRSLREKPKKCSVLPLRRRPDLIFMSYPVAQPPPLHGYIRLAAEGPELSSADAEYGLLLLDASWR